MILFPDVETINHKCYFHKEEMGIENERQRTSSMLYLIIKD
jgi:hypothetical protein